MRDNGATDSAGTSDGLQPLVARDYPNHNGENEAFNQPINDIAQLDDLSPQARAGWLEEAHKTLSDLPSHVDYAKLSRDGQIDFEILQHHLATQIWLA